jgi:ABC-type multidrug transport system fused ATPase/permease subunit
MRAVQCTHTPIPPLAARTETNPLCYSIDTKTDEIMQRVIREKFCNHTIIAVAHKLDTILDYDRIVVLDAGRIVENGEPYALLTEPKSHFSQLYASAMATEESD